jgi:acetylornithine deacetylase/succinyl-diaminopimelate desuccinylase-like protein
MWDPKTPAIVTMLRGLCGEEVIIHAADRDLHSGFYGMAAANPNRILAKILADLYDDQGRVTLPGFYDGVPELPESLKQQWGTLGFTAEKFLGVIGLSQPAGEKGRDALEMVWSRPTCEINGMGGGYQGDGFKTVIPAKASAKVSFRLVLDQDPHAIRKAFRAHVQARCPLIAALNSLNMARAAPFASRIRTLPSPRRARLCLTNGASPPSLSARAVQSRSRIC